LTVLVPMSPEYFENFLAFAIKVYADDKVLAGSWPEAQALERSRAEHAQLLPEGLASPTHHLFEIKDKVGGVTIGSVWLAESGVADARTAFIFNVNILPQYRRQGHASRAFEALEVIVRRLGCSSIGLHVFGHNPGAQAVYAKLGYNIVGITMRKRVEA
jgi:ribosomal protein S18 acetylase RimI-like enzyme